MSKSRQAQPSIDDMLLDINEPAPSGQISHACSNDMQLEELPDLESLQLGVREQPASHVPELSFHENASTGTGSSTADDRLSSRCPRPQLVPQSITEKLERIRAQYAAHRIEQRSIDAGAAADSASATAQSPRASSSSSSSCRRGPRRPGLDHYCPPGGDKSNHYCPGRGDNRSWCQRMGDHRNGPPRGRGQYNHNNNYNRKRRYNERDDDSYDNRPQNRRRHEPPPGSRLRNNMLRLAEGVYRPSFWLLQ